MPTDPEFWLTVVKSALGLVLAALAIWLTRAAVKSLQIWRHAVRDKNAAFALIPEMNKRLTLVLEEAQVMEHFVKVLMSSMPDGVFMTDRDGVCTWANKRMQKMTGRVKEELSSAGWIACVAKEDRAAVRDEYHSAMRDKRDVDIPFRLLRKSNGVAPIVDFKSYCARSLFTGELLGCVFVMSPQDGKP